MKKLNAVIVVFVFSYLLLIPVVYTESSALSGTYSWEDGNQTVFDSCGNVVLGGTVGGNQTGTIASKSGAFSVSGASNGHSYFKLTEHPHKNTPNVTVAVVTGLAEGDSIQVALDVWDESEGESPSYRLWFSEVKKDGQGGFIYAAGVDSSDFDTDYAPAIIGEWSTAHAEFNRINDRELSHDGIGIQVRLYSYPSTSDDSTDYYIDNLRISISTTSANAAIHFPNGITHIIKPDKTSYNAGIR